MMSSLQISGYRGFSQYQLRGLSRVNLMVGRNNCGKTSVLEAAYLLASAGDPWSLFRVLARRGERPLDSAVAPEMPRRPLVDVSRLFRGHAAVVGRSFTISSNSARVECQVVEATQAPLFSEEDGLLPGLILRLSGHPEPPFLELPLTATGGMVMDQLSPRLARAATRRVIPRFIAAESATSSELIQAWNSVALTRNESMVLRALQFLDPHVEGLAALNGPASYQARDGARGGFIVKMRGLDQPVPIGSLGDGVWRMLAMAITITQCRGGVLLVDEIDTGLHYTVMSRMWDLIVKAAKEFDVQVFATTHSYDCVYSLAQICSKSAEPVAVHRIDSSEAESVPYDQVDIVTTAARDIEVR